MYLNHGSFSLHVNVNERIGISQDNVTNCKQLLEQPDLFLCGDVPVANTLLCSDILNHV